MSQTNVYATREAAEAAAFKESQEMEINGVLTYFDGMNCNDYSEDEDEEICAGWDGMDRRCQCGNRRVAWQFYEGSAGWYYYAEAN